MLDRRQNRLLEWQTTVFSLEQLKARRCRYVPPHGILTPRFGNDMEIMKSGKCKIGIRNSRVKVESCACAAFSIR